MQKSETQLQAKIKYYIALRKTNVKTISKRTGIPQATLYRDIRNPASMTLERYWMIKDFLRMEEGDTL